eukprot:UN19192
MIRFRPWDTANLRFGKKAKQFMRCEARIYVVGHHEQGNFQMLLGGLSLHYVFVQLDSTHK